MIFKAKMKTVSQWIFKNNLIKHEKSGGLIVSKAPLLWSYGLMCEQNVYLSKMISIKDTLFLSLLRISSIYLHNGIHSKLRSFIKISIISDEYEKN